MYSLQTLLLYSRDEMFCIWRHRASQFQTYRKFLICSKILNSWLISVLQNWESYWTPLPLKLTKKRKFFISPASFGDLKWTVYWLRVCVFCAIVQFFLPAFFLLHSLHTDTTDTRKPSKLCVMTQQTRVHWRKMWHKISHKMWRKIITDKCAHLCARALVRCSIVRFVYILQEIHTTPVH